MHIRALARARSGAVCSIVLILVSLSFSGLTRAQQKGKEQQKYDKGQTQDIQTLLKMVADASAGQSVPSDFQVTWQNHYLKARDQRTFVPFTITIEPGKLSSPAIAMYVRAVKRGGEAPAPGQTPPKDQKDQKDLKKGSDFAFEDVHFIDLKANPAEAAKGAAAGSPAASPAYRFSRALSVPPGEYDVWVAIKERTPANDKDKNATPPKATVFKQTLTAPDFWSDDLLTSSIIVADKVEPLTAPTPESELGNRPYTFGMTQIVPALVNRFSKKDSLSLLFLVYNTALDANKKPDVVVEYNFNRKVEGGEKFFNATVPQKFNADTLPAQFDVAAGHQLVAGQEIPLASFPEGDYRLEIKVTDKVSSKTLTHNVNFTVTS
jgi:hypothetical protein